MKPMLITPPEQEVLDHMFGFRLRIFRGVGNWDVIDFDLSDFELAIETRRLKGGMLYARGWMPSRGPDVDGLATLPLDWRPECLSS
jgi:hypothetical protein